jgi:hypothetical protein
VLMTMMAMTTTFKFEPVDGTVSTARDELRLCKLGSL